MALIVLNRETKNEERLRYQEICTFCYIATHLVDGVYKQANQYTANAVLDGERKTAERTIKRLIEKCVIHVVPPAVPSKDAPAMLSPVSFNEFWRLYWRGRRAVQQGHFAVDTSPEMSTAAKGVVSSGKTPIKSTPLGPKDAASCPATKQRTCADDPAGRVQNRALQNTDITDICISRVPEYCAPEHEEVSSGKKWWCDNCGDALHSEYHKTHCGGAL